MDVTRTSKKLSYVLRHRPDSIGVTLSPDGWVGIDVLLRAFAKHGTRITRDELMQVVAQNDKKRFAVEGDRIRASQGHSVEVELGYEPATPPEVLYHGTARSSVGSIFKQGLVSGRRHHVHLSADTTTATKVGARHGSPVVLRVDSAAMAASGHVFYVSANGVWLTDAVPAQFLSMVQGGVNPAQGL